MINFRTLEDYLALRRCAVSGAKIAVVGGGFIGSELAASLASNGCKVTMLFPGEAIGAGRYPTALAHFLNAYYRERGVELKPGAKVVDGRIDGDRVEIALSDGTTQHADAVVAGLGVTPNVELAVQAGLNVDNGIVVDERLRSSDPDIWAAGDVANFHNAALDLRQRRQHEKCGGRHGSPRRSGHDRLGRGVHEVSVLLFGPVRPRLRSSRPARRSPRRGGGSGRSCIGKASSITSTTDACVASCCGTSGDRSRRHAI